jgi:hypothetical protein
LVGLVGVSAAILGFTNLVGEPRRRRWWSLAACGTWVAVLSKESFLPMAALGAIVAAYRWRCGASGRQELAFAVLCALPASIVTLVLARPVLSGGDVYGRSATGGRYSAALRALDEVPFRGVWLASILVVAAIVIWATTTHTAVERKLVGLFLATTTALVGWSLFDAWFNAGFYPLPRYRAVTDVVVLVLIGGAICLFVSGIRRRVSDPVGVAVIVGVLGMFVGLLYMIDGGIRNVESTASAADFNRAATREFQSGIDDFVDDDSGPVAVVVGQGGDYEPAFSVATQVRRRLAVDPDVYLIVAADESSHYPLLDSLREVSVHGAEGWPTTPLTDLDPAVHLRCVFINMARHDTEHCKADDSVTLVVYAM